MRLGIFSDIHANLEALKTVVEAYKEYNIEKYICLGDVAGYGADPNECCDIVKKLAQVTVIGNHDAAVCGKMDYSFYYFAARHALDWTANVLTPENKKWLSNLDYKYLMEGMCFCHGSPRHLEEFEYVYLLEHARSLLDIYDELENVTFIGHSHLCRIYALTPYEVEEVTASKITLRRDNKYIVSTGSVGQPRDYDNRACFTVFDTEKREFEFIRVPYSIEITAGKILEANLEEDFGRRLFLGM